MTRHGHHPPCPNGCGELADECACPNPNPLGSMTIEPPIGGRVRASHCPACGGIGWGGPGSACRGCGHAQELDAWKAGQR